MVGEAWDSIIIGFCKVEFLCYQGEPNWLGWLILGPVIGIVGFLATVWIIAGIASIFMGDHE